MSDLLAYPNLINLVHIFVVAPLLLSVGTGNFPQQYNQLLVVLALFVAVFHLYRLSVRQGWL